MSGFWRRWGGLIGAVIATLGLSVWYASQPTGTPIVWGLSPRRLLVLLVAWGLTVGCYLETRKQGGCFTRGLLARREVWALSFVVWTWLASLSPVNFSFGIRAAWKGLRPFWFWAAWNSGVAVTVLFVRSQRFQPFVASLRRWKSVIGWGAGVACATLAVVAWGGQSEMSGQGVAVPLEISWVWVSVLLVLVASALSRRILKKRGFWLSLGVWLLAIGVWMSSPPAYSYFQSPTLPPNDVPYPTSDAAIFDLAAWQGVHGYGYRPVEWYPRGNPFARKLGFVGILATFHLFTSHYGVYQWLLVAVLALTAVLLFWLGWYAHSLGAGLLLAFLMIWQEYTAIHVGELVYATSHVRLLMSEPWLRLWFVVFVAGVLGLYHRHRLRGWQAVALGTVLGAAFLIRAESLLLVVGWPLFLLVVACFFQKSRPVRRLWGVLSAGVLFFFGVLLVFAPWMARGSVLSSHLAVRSPLYKSPWFFWYQVHNALSPQYREGEAAPTSGVPPSLPAFQGKALAALSPRIAPVEAVSLEAYFDFAKGVSQRTAYNLAATLLALPPTGEIMPLADTIKASPFWNSRAPFAFSAWPWWSWAALLLNAFLLAVGGMSLWRASERARVFLLALLFVWVGYSLALAVARNGGGRYVVPINWIPLFFYAVGLSRGLAWVFGRFFGWQGLWPAPEERPSPVRSPRRLALTLGGGMIGFSWWVVLLEFFAIGWVAYRAAEYTPPRWHEPSTQEVIHRMDTLRVWKALPWPRATVVQALQDGTLEAAWGFLYHPLYFAPGTSCQDLCGFRTFRQPTLYFDSILPFSQGNFHLELAPDVAAAAVWENLTDNQEMIALYCPASKGGKFGQRAVLLIAVAEGQPSPVVLFAPGAPTDVCALTDNPTTAALLEGHSFATR